MVDLDDAEFFYSAGIKLSEFPVLRDAFPDVTELAINSKTFSDFAECVHSARDFMEDIINASNSSPSAKRKLFLSSELNPTISGEKTLSKNWEGHEIARLWIFEKTEKVQEVMVAFAQARILACEPNAAALDLN